MNLHTGRLLLMIFAILAVSCSSVPMQQEIPSTEVIHQTIASKSVHEDCVKAMPGQKIVYSFNASMPVNFNLHYHTDGQINYAALEMGASRAGVSSYTVELEQYYCLMWTNMHHMEVQLKYAYKVSD